MRNRSIKIRAVFLLVALATGCGSSTKSAVPDGEAGSEQDVGPSKEGGKSMSTFKITSAAFSPGGEIPARYTCQGEDLSVPLTFGGAPAGTRSLALIVDDPDAPDPAAPKMTWVHWVLYNLPADCVGLPQAVGPLPSGTLEGSNDWKRTGYGGPCPPIGRHRYFHKLYALDTVLRDLGQPTKDQLLSAMEGHVLAQTVLMGTYQKI